MTELAHGAVVGHYQIVRLLGQGGMGIVYEAIDKKLGRRVAVKLLSESTRNSSAARERFWREARAASLLNHPGICIVHELNETAESPFIVMELLEGNSLEKLYRGHAMPYPRLLELGIQVADAVDAAHRAGILHRDIKSANIFLTQSGQVKLLDFGLAKLNDLMGIAAHVDANATTDVKSLSSSGSALGTVAYMSPEQARGELLDTRTDVFSLGVVLYEMATGRHPFPGSTAGVVFDQILNHAPVAPIKLNSQLPTEFGDLLNKALEKDRELRCQSAADLRAGLKRLQRPAGSGDAMLRAGDPRPSSSAVTGRSEQDISAANLKSHPLRLMITLAAIALAVGVFAWHLWPRPRPFLSISVSQITSTGTVENIAISPDGRFLAEVKNDDGQRTLWVRNIATNTDTQISSTFNNAYIGMTFSPDANYLYFTRGTPDNNSERSLYVTPVFGGTPKQLIYDVDSVVSFAPDGKRFTYVRWTPDRKDQLSELHVADRDGGNDQMLYSTLQRIKSPVWSPDGHRIAWIGSGARTSISWIDIRSKKVAGLPPPPQLSFPAAGDSTDATSLAWLPDKRHILARYYKLHSDRAQIGIVTLDTGALRTITNDVNSYSEFALSGDGKTLATVLRTIDSSVAYYPADGGSPLAATPLRVSPNAIAWANEDRLLFLDSGMSLGTIDRATGNIRTFDLDAVAVGSWMNTCPDGHILFTGRPKGSNEARLFRMNADGTEITQITTAGIARAPFCSSDSKQVFFSIRKGPQTSLWVIPAAGGAAQELLQPVNSPSTVVSRDGRLAATLVAEHQKFSESIADLTLRSSLRSLPREESVVSNYPPHFSPDGRALVYVVLRDGRYTLMYQPLDGSSSRLIFNPVSEPIADFDWSPSAKLLAVLHRKSSSDVVLITDQDVKTIN